MSSSSAAAEAMAGASRRARTVIGFAGSRPATSRGQSEQPGSLWESPRRGAYQAAHQKRACKGGRVVPARVSDGPAMDHSGCPCSVAAGFGRAAPAK
jgi:hypothetical protein